jgi:iron only hydrogenase large subunit-like protein
VAESIVVEETRREMLGRKNVLITSHCPGWSCYATKVLDESILSHMSRIKAPEQLMGLIVKRLIPSILAQNFFKNSQIRNLRHFSAPHDEKILHVLISPCFDKKLEIIRPDYTTMDGVKGVDLVLATSELLDLMSRTIHIDHDNIKESKEVFDIHDMFSLRDSWAVSESGCDSGGYAQATLASMGDNDWTPEKNKDILKLENNIRSHGFRNIQNITRRLTSDKLKDVNIVELMACPGGCPRGGGQPPVRESEKPYISFLDRIFSTTSSSPGVNHNEVDYVCAPSEYIPGKIIRDSISKILGPDFLSEFLTTEWKSTISQKDDATGIHPSSVKW